MAVISNAIANTNLLGVRIYRISAQCPGKRMDGDAQLDVDVNYSVENLKSRRLAAYAELTMTIDSQQGQQEKHRLFEIEVYGAIKFSSKVDSKLFDDPRFVHVTCKPLYTAAALEFKKLSAAMDLGEVFLSMEMPWPKGYPRNLDDSVDVGESKKMYRPLKKKTQALPKD